MPQTKYARNGEIHIAYQVVGSGPPDLLSIPGWLSHVEGGWEFPPIERFHQRLASFSRLILMDKRGTGASDRAVPSLALEDQLDDLRAVLDHAESDRSFLFGTMDGGALALLFAATYPERVRGVITLSARARFMTAHDYPWGTAESDVEMMLGGIADGWSNDAANIAVIRSFNPTADDSFIDWSLRQMRSAGSPGTAAALIRMYTSMDIRSVLPSVNVPVLVLNQVDDVFTSPAHGEYLADHIPGARFVAVPGADFMPIASLGLIADEVQEFVTGARAPIESDRVFATILYTDFVDSTHRSAELGDRAWRHLLDRHDEIARRQLQRFRGHLVKHTGDGFVATFDGPGRAIRCAMAMREAVTSLGLTMRVGLHAGEVEPREEDISGIAVSIASRVMNLADAGEILVSSTVKDLVVGSDLEFSERGASVLKGVPGEWNIYEVRS